MSGKHICERIDSKGIGQGQTSNVNTDMRKETKNKRNQVGNRVQRGI